MPLIFWDTEKWSSSKIFLLHNTVLEGTFELEIHPSAIKLLSREKNNCGVNNLGRAINLFCFELPIPR